MDNVAQLYDTAVLGTQVESFLLSDVGKYLVAKAEREVETALSALRRVQCTNAEEIQRLQNQIWRAESIQAWLGEAITDGLGAQELIEERE